MVLAFDTTASEDFGGIARKKNTGRVFVGPEQFNELATTGTWVLQQTSNVPEFFTTDAGSTNILGVWFPGPVSDATVQGSSVDRGTRVIGVEVFYTVATSALGDFVPGLFSVAFTDADGVATATAITATEENLPAANDGTEIDNHRLQLEILEVNRAFLDSGTQVYLELNITDGTASDVTIRGAVWHYETLEE